MSAGFLAPSGLSGLLSTDWLFESPRMEASPKAVWPASLFAKLPLGREASCPIHLNMFSAPCWSGDQ